MLHRISADTVPSYLVTPIYIVKPDFYCNKGKKIERRKIEGWSCSTLRAWGETHNETFVGRKAAERLVFIYAAIQKQMKALAEKQADETLTEYLAILHSPYVQLK